MDKLNVKGFFEIQMIKDGCIVDRYSNQNLIMNNAKLNILNSVIKGSTSPVINKIIIGTDGIDSEDLPKSFGSGFDATRLETFSEENDKYYYYIDFENETGIVTDETEPNSKVKCTIDNRLAKYEFTIPTSNANGNFFSEAALYTNLGIFSMKCFEKREKTSEFEMKIIWRIQF